jgi:outer membrane protein OmpA-like peptidoglycan-associated protein
VIAAARTQADRTPAAPARRLPPRRHDAAGERDADRVARFGSPAPPVQEAIPRGHGGRLLEDAVREWAEPRVGFDLASVRIHDDAEAHVAAGERHARALASGGDVLFARGAYRPGTPDGRELLLHELAHVAQQAGGPAATQHQDDAPRTGGIGRTPPDAEYAVAEEPATGPEDLAVLFPHDEVTPEKGFRDRFQALLRARTGPVLVRIHGYASREGEPGYNVNLSAHRAVAARGAILDLLPTGSRVELVAHGETAAFGEPPGNRRVGITIADLPAPSGVTLDADRWLRNRPGVLPGEGLRLEPLRLPPVIDWQIGDPTRAIAPPRALDLRPLPLSYLEERIPWGEFHGVARARGATLGPGDQALILRHYQMYYPLAAALSRLNPTPWGPNTPDDVMSIFTSKLIDNSLMGDRPNAIEAFNRELERQGIPTPTTFGGGFSF